MEPEELAGAIVQGTINTQKRFEQMSGGLWLEDAPEYFLTSQLGVNLNENLGFLCTLEEPMVNFPLGRGAPSHLLRRNGKADIALWNNDEQITAIVEVKNGVYHSSCEYDLHRLAIFARRIVGRPIGAFAYYQVIWGLDEQACRLFSEQATNNLRITIERCAHQYGLKGIHLCSASEPEQFDDDLFYSYLAYASTFQARE